MVDPKCFKLSFQSTLKIGRLAVDDIMSILESFNPRPTDEVLCDIKLIFHELICNAILHGNKEDSSKKVYVSIAFEHDKISGSVRDEGNGFSRSTLNLIKHEDYCDWHKENGRGLKIVNELSDFLELNQKGNEVNFYKLVKNSAQNSDS